MLIAFIFASTLVTTVVPGAAIAQPTAAPLDQFLESRVPDELAVEGIILGQRELVIKVEQIGDKLLISLIATPTGRVVASSKVDDPPTDREASLAIVTQVTATLYTQYTMLPSPPPGAQLDQPTPVTPTQPSLPRTGLTLEFEMGLARPGAATGTSPELGIGLGVGAWIFPGRVALLGRLAMATVDGGQTAVSASYIANTFIGANVQYWLDDHVWLAAGPGFVAFTAAQAYDSILPTKSACTPDCLGVGLDLRAGYSLGAGSHQLDLSVEAIAGYYANDPSRGLHMGLDTSEPGQSGYATTLIAMLGYRFL
jgi:hypothetical protein